MPYEDLFRNSDHRMFAFPFRASTGDSTARTDALPRMGRREIGFGIDMEANVHDQERQGRAVAKHPQRDA